MTLSINDGGRLSPFTNTFKLPDAFLAETEKSSQEQLYHLISLQIPDHKIENTLPDELVDGSYYMHMVDANHDVVYGGRTYYRFPVKFTGASISSDGTIDKANVMVANVSRDIMYYVEYFNGLRNMRVKVKTVYAKFLDKKYVYNLDGTVTVTDNEAEHGGTGNVTAYIEDEFLIDNYTANAQTVVFQLDPIIDLDVRLPKRRYVVDSCYWKFKDPTTCKYSGAETNCPKTFTACKLRLNEANYGGFPGINANRRIML